MADRPASRVVILAEDRRQANFARHCLKKLGQVPGRFREVPCPSGRGDGIRHVLDHYPIEVRALRRHSGRILLVAVIDADEHQVEDRHAELARALREAGQEQRGPEEPIAELVPRRQIETWILALQGRQVSEDTKKQDLKPPVRDSDVKPAAGAYPAFCRNPAGNALPSLLDGCRELRRLQ